MIVVLVVIAAGIFLVPKLFDDDGGSQAVERVDGIPIPGAGPPTTPEQAWKKRIERCEGDDANCTVAADADNVYVGTPHDEDVFEVNTYTGGSG